MVEILKSLFRDLKIGINQMDHEISENHGPETLGSSLRFQDSRHPKKIKIYVVSD